MRQRRVLRALAIPLAFAFVAASCGSDDDSGDSGDGAEETTAPDATDGDDGDGAEETTAPDTTDGDVDTSIVENTEEVVYGGEVILGLEAEANGLRPWEDGCASSCYNISYSIYDPLMRQTAEGTFEPYLAESLESNDDFTVWTMTLRPGVTFSDGTPLTAQTIADMFPIQQGGAIAGSTIATIALESVEATGELEVTYTLGVGNSAFPSYLQGQSIGLVFEPAAAAADPEGFNSNPIGTGPFTLESRDLDNETVVVRREGYWFTTGDGNQLPYLDRIRFRPIPDEGTRLDSLTSNTINAMTTLRGATVRDAQAASGLNLVLFQGNGTGAGHYNTLVPPLDDVRVRRGLNQMIDQDSAIEALGDSGISTPSTQWFSPDDPFWTQEAADTYLAFDFESGSASVQEYVDDPARSDGKAPGDPIDVTLSCPPDPTLIAYMQVIEQVWNGSGLVNVELTSFDQATHINNALSDQHEAHCWRFGGSSDPGALLAGFVADPEVSVTNYSNYNSPAMQEALTQANLTADFDERKALFSQIMQEINEQALTWYAGSTPTLIATAENVVGVNNWELPEGSLGVGIPDAVTHWSQVFVTE